MVELVTNFFLETLRDLVVGETNFLFGAGDEVEQVSRDLRSIHELLMKADRDGRDSPSVKELRDVADKAENVLETYALEVDESNKESRWRFMGKFQRYHKVGKEARDIKSRLADLRSKLESELGQQSSSHSSHEDELWRQTYAHEVEPHFVGMERDVELLVSMVKDETTTTRRKVIKIYGMGGLGKTTLARKIYNHVELASYARAWVCITQRIQPKAVLSTILNKLGGGANTNSMGVPELVGRIHNFLEQRKCLIVIDDIWENEHWEIIKPAFPINCNVLLTTRYENLANRECDHPHKLELLTQDQGWELLQKIALPQANVPVESLEDIGKEIVVKCGGLPLSISVIGGTLRLKEEGTRLAEWKKVNMNIDSYLRHGGEGVTENKRVKQVLDLSYDSLPYYLKPCFLYLASFPEDANIGTERLYLLWMAEGFISHQDKGRNETLRDVAERYLTELAMRCMVQVVLRKGDTYSPHDKFHSCRLHDLMHDLCSSKVGAEKEEFLERIDVFSRYAYDIPSISTSTVARPSSIGNSSSRVAITIDTLTDKLSTIEGLDKVKDLTSFMLFSTGYRVTRIHFEDNAISFDRSPRLRILVLDSCEFEDEKLPSMVGKLIHMRYLSLRDTNVRELPQFVCGMPYLHTLDLRNCEIRLPNTIWKMKRLRHLFLSGWIEVIGGEKLRLDGLVELETLDYIYSKTTRVADLPKLKSLRKLGVYILDVDSMSVVANHMRNGNSQLRETHFSVMSTFDAGGIDISSEIGRDALKNVLMSPSLVTLYLWDCNVGDGFRYYQQGMCENLVKLKLTSCQVGGDVMEEWGKYPMLQTLFMHHVEFGTAETLIFPSNSFPQLKSLELHFLDNLKRLQVEEGAMPKLTNIKIMGCSDLEEFPDGLRFISTLQQSDIMAIRTQFEEDRARRQDGASVSHIPSIRFDIADNVDATTDGDNDDVDSDNVDATTYGDTDTEPSQDEDTDAEESEDQGMMCRLLNFFF